ncbi:DNA methylase, partial [Amycolatopsis sp. NPDC000673]
AAAATPAGLAPLARCTALTATVRRGRTHTRASLAQRRAAARAERVLGHPVALPAHHTALVLRADPDAADPVLNQSLPALPALPRPHRPWHRARRDSAAA